VFFKVVNVLPAAMARSIVRDAADKTLRLSAERAILMVPTE
jgi:hypothetical protein